MSDTAQHARLIALRADLRLALAQVESPSRTLARCADALVEHLEVALAAFWWSDGPGDAAELVASSRARSPDGLPHRVSLDAAGAGLHLSSLTGVELAPPALIQAERVTSLVAQPLLAADRAMGVVALYGTAEIPVETLHALASIADLIAIALDHRRLARELADASASRQREAVRSESAQRNAGLHHRVSQILASGVTFAGIAPDLIRHVVEALGWDLGAVWHLEVPLNLRQVTVWHAEDPELKSLAGHLQRLAQVRDTGVLSEVVRTGRPVFWPDALNHEMIEDLPGQRIVRCALGIPITGDGEVIGALILLSRSSGCAVDDELTVALTAVGAILGQFLRRKLVEEQLIQAQKMEAVGKLAGGVAHDFNNILTVITGYAAMSLEQVQQGTSLHDQAHEILSAAERAASLVNQLLAFSRKQVFHPRMIDLNIVVGDMERMLRRLIGEDVRLVTRRPEQPSMVRADLVHVEQVIVNLAVNSRDAMPQGGRLYIEITHIEQDGQPFAKITVRDTGVGMSDDVRNHAFEPFFTTKETGKGTGLGLATVYGIVRQNGGLIRVESESGKGAQFTILFPRVVQGGVPAVARDARPAAARGTETVLLVEDERPVRRLARNILKNAGYDVVEAGTAEEALQICSTSDKPIQLLLTDVVMPGMNGVELSHKLTATVAGLKVLYMSGYAEDSLFDGYAMARGVAFLEKPFTPTGLAQRVRQVLDAPRPETAPAAERAVEATPSRP